MINTKRKVVAIVLLMIAGAIISGVSVSVLAEGTIFYDETYDTYSYNYRYDMNGGRIFKVDSTTQAISNTLTERHSWVSAYSDETLTITYVLDSTPFSLRDSNTNQYKSSYGVVGVGFLGWSLTPNGSSGLIKSYQFSPVDINNALLILYAQWELPKPHTITWQANGGTFKN
ncbi:MAG: hypothetical protein RRY18_01850 [Clostridia bacterium]